MDLARARRVFGDALDVAQMQRSSGDVKALANESYSFVRGARDARLVRQIDPARATSYVRRADFVVLAALRIQKRHRQTQRHHAQIVRTTVRRDDLRMDAHLATPGVDAHERI